MGRKKIVPPENAPKAREGKQDIVYANHLKRNKAVELLNEEKAEQETKNEALVVAGKEPLPVSEIDEKAIMEKYQKLGGLLFIDGEPVNKLGV